MACGRLFEMAAVQSLWSRSHGEPTRSGSIASRTGDILSGIAEEWIQAARPGQQVSLLSVARQSLWRHLTRGLPSRSCASIHLETLETTLLLLRAAETFVLAGKGTIAQLNYNRIGTGLPFHRATVQRLVRELLSKLGSHILCNQLLQVLFIPDSQPSCFCVAAVGQHTRTNHTHICTMMTMHPYAGTSCSSG